MSYTLQLAIFKERFEGLSPEAKRIFGKNLELIILVAKNYNHIQDFDVLIHLFERYNNVYEREYYPGYDLAYKLSADVCKRNHSTSDRERITPHEDYLLTSIIKDYYPNLYKDNKHIRIPHEIELMNYWNGLDISERVKIFDSAESKSEETFPFTSDVKQNFVVPNSNAMDEVNIRYLLDEIEEFKNKATL